MLGDGTEHLNRECSVFTDDSRYIIVGSAVNVPTDPPPTFYEVCQLVFHSLQKAIVLSFNTY